MSKKTRVYTIGKGPMPKWCQGLLMQYRRFGGETGYEFHGTLRVYDLQKGDTLTLQKGKISIRRKEDASDGCKGVFAPAQKARKND